MPSAEAEAPRALLSREADFWLAGGASILVWAIMLLLDLRRDLWSARHHLENAAIVASSLSLLVNYPHFMASYKIAYSRGGKFVARHWFQLIFIPAMLLVAFWLAYMSYAEPSPLPAYWNPMSLRRGEGLVTLLVQFMFLTVGWHYVKQTFGCMMVFGRLDHYNISKGQRRTLLYLLYTIWAISLLGSQTSGTPGNFYGARTISLGISEFYVYAGMALLWALTCGFMFHVIFLKWKRERKLPSVNYLTPLVAMLIWWIPIFRQNEFYFYLVPMFHSLQYFPFALRYEKGRLQEKKARRYSATFIVLALIATGFLAFEVFPDLAEKGFAATGELKGVGFFFVLFHVFINVHHYFIDNAIWRFHHAEVNRYLFRT